MCAPVCVELAQLSRKNRATKSGDLAVANRFGNLTGFTEEA
ncbi:hypothetical protein N9L76_07715 [bacterium]|nr:hypothetical protein [bacterium]